VLHNPDLLAKRQEVPDISPALSCQKRNAKNTRILMIVTGAYREQLIKCGEFYLSPDFIDQWGDELVLCNTASTPKT